MINRRKFLEQAGAAGALIAIPNALKSVPYPNNEGVFTDSPVVISTWNHGLEANFEAIRVLKNGGSVTDAVEKGVMVVEADPDNMSVGIGGMPDITGIVTLDASIMGPDGNAGSVCFLENIIHPISVARMVMDSTPHVMLAGEGALRFALENGFKESELLTEKTKKDYLKNRDKHGFDPKMNWENEPDVYHDTIGLLALDNNGDIAGACTTSGLGYKMRGRVGDSPIIGAGLFVDNEIGGATATGMGELVMKTVGSFLVVELMRNGRTPQEAVEEAVARIVKKVPDHKTYQIGFIAVDKRGNTGAYCLNPGFNYALYKDGKNVLTDSRSYY
jgi:N4-(beta-N-acetylglucosaminyl)-L-asparaginase